MTVILKLDISLYSALVVIQSTFYKTIIIIITLLVAILLASEAHCEMLLVGLRFRTHFFDHHRVRLSDILAIEVWIGLSTSRSNLIIVSQAYKGNRKYI